MSEVRGVVVAHGELASALVRVVEGISGVQGALESVTNVSCSPDELAGRVARAVGEGPAVVFVDMAAGSCGFAGQRIARDGNVALVSGVNLPMLLDFVFHREMDFRALAERVVEKGRTGTCRATSRCR
jgi:mannose/fructose-specific phosphotransferase system component IIA